MNLEMAEKKCLYNNNKKGYFALKKWHSMKINGLQLRTNPSRTHYCNASLLFLMMILISCSVRKLRLHYSKTTLLDKGLFLIKKHI